MIELRSQHATFTDEILDAFERGEALRLAGAASYKACMQGTAAYYELLDLSKHLQLKLLHLPFHSVWTNGIFNVEAPVSDDDESVPFIDRLRFFDLRQRLLAAVEARRSAREE